MSPTQAAQAAEAQTRPRVEGEREQEILDATIDILAEVGYDRLTMDAVAARAKASKATLYRRWNGKAQLVIDALISQKEPMTIPDTGTLRGDLLGAFCGMGGLTDGRQIAILGSVITAMARDAEFAEAFRRDFIGPKKAMSTEMFRRAQERGEIQRRPRPRADRRRTAGHRPAPHVPARRPADRRADRQGGRPDHPPCRDPRLTSHLTPTTPSRKSN